MTDRSRFELKLAKPYWVSNFEETRWFFALQLQRPEENELNRLLAVCNRIVEDYSQPPLYASSGSTSQQSPKPNALPNRHGQNSMSSSSRTREDLDFSSAFHISIGWALEQPSSYVIDTTKATINDTVFKSLNTVSVKVDTLKIKVGNIITSIHLAQKSAEGKSLYGA
jgi:hypothetical protein